MKEITRKQFMGSMAATVALGRRGDDDAVVVGPTTVEVPTPLERLPHFVREQ